jgi:hypothetical protein
MAYLQQPKHAEPQSDARQLDLPQQVLPEQALSQQETHCPQQVLPQQAACGVACAALKERVASAIAANRVIMVFMI